MCSLIDLNYNEFIMYNEGYANDIDYMYKYNITPLLDDNLHGHDTTLS